MAAQLGSNGSKHSLHNNTAKYMHTHTYRVHNFKYSGSFYKRVNHRRRLTGCRGCQCTHRQRVDGCRHVEEKLSKTQLEKCTHCGQLILRKISKIGATRCQIRKMHQIRFPLGLRPRPPWGSLQRSPDLLAVFTGPTSKEKEGVRGMGKVRGEEREG